MITLDELKNQKPSERIRFALKALEDFENTENCVVDMNIFHAVRINTENKKFCVACLAGATALQLLSKDRWPSIDSMSDFLIYLEEDDEEIDVYSFIFSLESGLNYLRLGNINSFLDSMKVLYEPYHTKMLSSYHYGVAALFKIDLENIARTLEKDGL